MPVLSGFWTSILISAGLNALIATGLYFSNSAGALSVAHAAIAGLAGYLSAVLTTNFGAPFGVAILAGVALGAVTGALLAAATLRMNPLVAGLATLAFGETMVVVIFNIDYLGGANSFSGIPFLTSFWMVALALVLVLLVAWRFDRSRLGYAAQACRHSSSAAAAMGINVPLVRIQVFALGAGVAALGGALRAHYVLVVSPSDLAFWVSVNYVIFWVFGGSYAFWGPATGAIILTVLPEFLRFSSHDRLILYGLALVVLIILRPEGLITRVGLGASRWGRLRPVAPPQSEDDERRDGR
jgi:branched-chain amino acid transport system permease protein